MRAFGEASQRILPSISRPVRTYDRTLWRRTTSESTLHPAYSLAASVKHRISPSREKHAPAEGGFLVNFQPAGYLAQTAYSIRTAYAAPGAETKFWREIVR
jgi:hypothetical protein